MHRSLKSKSENHCSETQPSCPSMTEWWHASATHPGSKKPLYLYLILSLKRWLLNWAFPKPSPSSKPTEHLFMPLVIFISFFLKLQLSVSDPFMYLLKWLQNRRKSCWIIRQSELEEPLDITTSGSHFAGMEKWGALPQATQWVDGRT